MTTIDICIPTIPGREELVNRAVTSAHRQVHDGSLELMAHVALDVEGEGAAPTRNRAWRLGDAEWVAFLDDDDELRPNHISLLHKHAVATGADLVYPWFNIHTATGDDITNNDPLSVPVNGKRVTPYGVQFNDELRNELMTRNNFIPITVLVRRSFLEKVNGLPHTNTEEWPEDCCEDWGLWRRLLNAGAKFEHLPRRTWIWYWHGKNTSGKSWKRQR